MGLFEHASWRRMRSVLFHLHYRDVALFQAIPKFLDENVVPPVLEQDVRVRPESILWRNDLPEI